MWWMMMASALAGDLWLELDVRDDGGEVHLMLPANDLLDDDASSTVEVNGTTVKLSDEARALKKRGKGERRFDVDGGTLVLALRDGAAKTEATSVAVGLKGPLGMGLEFTLPLDGSQSLDPVAAAPGQAGVDLGVDGLDLDLGPSDVDQLRRAGPLDLVRIVGPKGGGLTVSTR
jgi:hypothetical protein